MLPSLVITLREGIEAALVVGLTLSYLEKTGRNALKRAVWYGLALAVLGSVLGALALHLLPLSEEKVEGTLMLVAALFVGTTMVVMHRAARQMSGGIRATVDKAAGAGGGGAWALGLFVFFMVIREGAETVLFLSAVQVSTSGLLNLLGSLLGLAIAVAFAVLFFKGTIQLPLQRFFFATNFVLGVLVVELLLHAYHEYSEIGWMPATKASMAIVGPAVKHSALFVIALLALPMVLFLTSGKSRSAATAESEGGAEPGPAARKARAEAARRKAWGAAFLGGGAVVIGLMIYEFQRTRDALTPPDAVAIALEGDGVAIPLTGLEPDKQHLYVVQVDGHAVRFFVWLVGSEPKVALDACEICGSRGYAQQGRQLTCINCGAEIYPPSLGQTGGCNPIPLPFAVEGSVLRIGQPALAASASLF